MQKAVIAMSGGVDSSVAAALLKQQGYDVIGMMLRLWSDSGKTDSNRCCTHESMAPAPGGVAAGHYARLELDGTGRVRLLRALDFSKDQSYVLHVLDQGQLRHA